MIKSLTQKQENKQLFFIQGVMLEFKLKSHKDSNQHFKKQCAIHT